MSVSSSSRFRPLAILFAGTVALVGACSDSGGTTSSSSGGGSSSSGSVGDGGRSDGGSSGDAMSVQDADVTGCNMLEQLGSQITAKGDPASQPTATGGTLLDGTYVLTEVKLHGLPEAFTNPAGALTATVSGTTMNTVATNQMGQVSRNTFTIAVNGTSFVLTETCKVSAGTGTPAFDKGSYSVNPNDIRLMVSLSNGAITVPSQLVLTKR